MRLPRNNKDVFGLFEPDKLKTGSCNDSQAIRATGNMDGSDY